MNLLFNFTGLLLFVISLVYILFHIVDVIQTKINEKATFRYFVFTVIRFIVAFVVLYFGTILLNIL